MRGLQDSITLLVILLAIIVELSNAAPGHDFESNSSPDKLEKLQEFEEAREKDRESLRKEAAPGVVGTIPQVGELFEGDMIMDEDLRQAVLGEADKRSVLKRVGKKWPKGIVPFEFAPDILIRSKICVLKAMRSFHQHTCIRFVKRTTEKDYILIKSEPHVCMSYVGRKGGEQPVTIGRGCTRLGTCQHELLHALGTIHEQSRPDRNAHIKIIWSNIRDAERHNFNKYSYSLVTDEGVEYDFRSVMHYPNHAFAKDRSLPTIVSRKDPELGFGQRKMFTIGDVRTINRLYNCPPDKSAKDLPAILSDEEVELRRDLREREESSFY